MSLDPVKSATEAQCYYRAKYPLKIQTTEDYPSIYDLSISLPFSIFTAPVQDSSTSDDDNAAFRLKKDAYNGVTASQVTMSMLCKYNLKGHYTNIADATKCQSIISVAGDDDNKTIKDRKLRNEELEKLVKKFSLPPRNEITEFHYNAMDLTQSYENTIDLTQSDQNSTEHSHTIIENDTDDQHTDKDDQNNSDDINASGSLDTL
ncbi:19169_t:CDS:2 [Cetraspora pellucida]|uniref:19169_t:CDS:1 n=1 Tax=Cetraspora pellucida TaxID=1433469 RepID=A0A9N9JLZ0_9GLOM|nr:19169_t:CDS:2 [Cetraspora pellucida]